MTMQLQIPSLCLVVLVGASGSVRVRRAWSVDGAPLTTAATVPAASASRQVTQARGPERRPPPAPSRTPEFPGRR